MTGISSFRANIRAVSGGYNVCTILIPATIMTSTATVSQVMANAVKEIDVEDERLSINKVYVRPHPCYDHVPCRRNASEGLSVTTKKVS
jgi:hypothetical protein